MKKRLPVRRAIFYIFCSLLLVLGSWAAARWWFVYRVEGLKVNDRYLVRAILQTGPERCVLPTEYFAEWLGLSADEPPNLYALDLDRIASRLCESPLLAEVAVGRHPPEALTIDYTVREPVARLANWTNCAVDWTGSAFPLYPYFAPKRLPEIYVGESPALALEILRRVEEEPFSQLAVERIDTSNAAAKSLGRREIVVRVREAEVCHLLRLGVEEYERGLYNYLALREELDAVSFSIDLRLDELAFLSPLEDVSGE